MADDTLKGGGKEETEEVFEPLEVDDHGKPLAPAAGTGTAKGAEDAAAGEQDTLQGAASEDDDEDLDERVALNEEERETRKQERKLRAQRRRELNRHRDLENAQLRRQNDEMERRLAALEQGQGRVNITILNDKLATAETQVRQAEDALTRAAANIAKDPARFTEALHVANEARAIYTRLADYKTRVDAAGRGGGRPGGAQPDGRTREERPEPLPPSIQGRVSSFQNRHKWYDQAARDVDSQIVTVLDTAVSNEGFDPSGEEYWKELEKRMRSALPHRFMTAADNGAASGGRAGPPLAGGGESGSGGRAASGKNYVRVTPARRKAMEDAGSWDDPVKRNRMLKAYAKYDREHPPSGAA